MASPPKTLWRPSEALLNDCRLADYMKWLAAERNLAFDDYQSLWRWSVDQVGEFWQSIVDFFEVEFHSPPTELLSNHDLPGARFFPGATLNYAEQALRHSSSHPAVIYRAEAGVRQEIGWNDLNEQVARVRAGMARIGVGVGDRVVAYLPNNPESLIAMLAAASLGAAWSSCPPEFGVESVLDRFRQIEPKLLIGTDSYRYGGKTFDRRVQLEQIAAGMSTLEAKVLSRPGSQVSTPVPGWVTWEELSSAYQPIAFEAVPFDHPLWILYSSGTTGLPKPIIHGHGGIVLEHLKVLALHSDIRPGDRFFWYSTTGWMMWNYLVSGLMVGATVVLYDGSPTHPDLNAIFALADEEDVTYLGMSAPLIMACRKRGLSPRSQFGFESLRSIGSTAAPLPPEGFHWVYEEVKRDVLLGSVSGGTDVCSAFLVSCPLLPVRAGELQVPALGAKIEAWDEAANSVVDEVGELVITEPLPSMPTGFWNDPEGVRYRESYFERYPGVWCHGDWIRIDKHGRSVVYGRSDSTLNRGGVRIGTSDFYRVLESLPELIDSLVIDTGTLGKPGELWLFVALAEGHILDEVLVDRLRRKLRTQLSPRHVPDQIRSVSEIPSTLSGKKLEVPIKRILSGTPLDRAVTIGALKNPRALYDLLATVD